jgi:hypothetical protein
MRCRDGFLVVFALVASGFLGSAGAQNRDREGEAMMGGMLNMFGQILELEREKARLENERRGGVSRQNSNQVPIYQLPNRPELPPLPTDGRRGEWRN